MLGQRFDLGSVASDYVEAKLFGNSGGLKYSLVVPPWTVITKGPRTFGALELDGCWFVRSGSSTARRPSGASPRSPDLASPVVHCNSTGGKTRAPHPLSCHPFGHLDVGSAVPLPSRPGPPLGMTSLVAIAHGTRLPWLLKSPIGRPARQSSCLRSPYRSLSSHQPALALLRPSTPICSAVCPLVSLLDRRLSLACPARTRCLARAGAAAFSQGPKFSKGPLFASQRT